MTTKKRKKVIFRKIKKVIRIYDTDVNKTLDSKKNQEPNCTKKSIKYFVGYDDDDDAIRPLCIKHPRMIGYVKCFDSNKTISPKSIDNKLSKKYNQIWKKVKNSLNIKFGSEPVYGDHDKYIKKKIKLYGDKVNTNLLNLLNLR